MASKVLDPTPQTTPQQHQRAEAWVEPYSSAARKTGSRPQLPEPSPVPLLWPPTFWLPWPRTQPYQGMQARGKGVANARGRRGVTQLRVGGCVWQLVFCRFGVVKPWSSRAAQTPVAAPREAAASKCRCWAAASSWRPQGGGVGRRVGWENLLAKRTALKPMV